MFEREFFIELQKQLKYSPQNIRLYEVKIGRYFHTISSVIPSINHTVLRYWFCFCLVWHLFLFFYSSSLLNLLVSTSLHVFNHLRLSAHAYPSVPSVWPRVTCIFLNTTAKYCLARQKFSLNIFSRFKRVLDLIADSIVLKYNVLMWLNCFRLISAIEKIPSLTAYIALNCTLYSNY